MEDLRVYKRISNLEERVDELYNMVYSQQKQIETLAELCESLLTLIKEDNQSDEDKC